jgi:ubiquinone/menaquinone biosynthesis C-methylase UbiE
MSLGRHRRDWEDLAAEDLHWSILSDPAKRFGGWSTSEFRRSGELEIDRLFETADRLGMPTGRERALDFGCGAGRLTRALAPRFHEVVGVDISERMLEEARRTNDDVPVCRFVLNDAPDLSQFENETFDLVYTSIVLQHVDDEAVIRSYVQEFVRVLRPGGLLAFQLPSRIPARHRLQPRRRVYRLLRVLHVPRRVLFRRLRLQPIAMRSLPEEDVMQLVERAGGRIVERTSREVSGVTSSEYYATKLR